MTKNRFPTFEFNAQREFSRHGATHQHLSPPSTRPLLLALLLLGIFASWTKADLIDFHFSGQVQTGPAVLGSAGDVWNRTTVSNGGPVSLVNTKGQATTVSISWTGCDSWAPTRTLGLLSNYTKMDAATSWLMCSANCSYQYSPGFTNLAVSFTGLSPNTAYTLVLLGAGDQPNEGTQFVVNGNGTFTASTSGLNRKLSAGPGVAYAQMRVISSAKGTLRVNTTSNGYHWAVLNGFQLASDVTTTPVTGTPTAPSSNATPNSGTAPTGTTTPSNNGTSVGTSPSSSRDIAWGINGHPTWSDYSNYISANTANQVSYLQQLGCKYYRCAFGVSYPSILDTVVPQSAAGGITVLPILPVTFDTSVTTDSNYNSNYALAAKWANYAITKGYALPYWELGNEIEGYSEVSIIYDGASANDFPDAKPNGFASIASGLSGAYQGIKDTYATARANGKTTVTPQVLFGCCYRHWGFLAKLQQVNGALPCDIISWHWYGPNYGVFNQPIVDPNSVSNGRTPAQCLADFKSRTNSGQPMDVWITETNRSQRVGSTLLNGSVTNNASPATSQDWAAQATAIKACIDSFKAVPTIKGIFVYELFDETKADNSSTSLLASEGYLGLVTGLNGTPKDAFYTFQAEIATGPTSTAVK